MEYLPILLATVAVVLSALAYKLNSRLREDAWARTLREFHQFFWTDSDCKEVRSWIACQSAYDRVADVLAKRKSGTELTEEEYKEIEKIDKFFALLIAFRQIEERHKIHKDISKRLFDTYWIKEIDREKRQSLHWYMNEFYAELIRYTEESSTSNYDYIRRFFVEKSTSVIQRFGLYR